MNANIKGITKNKKTKKRTYEDIISNVVRDYMHCNAAPTTTSHRSVASSEVLQIVSTGKGVVFFVLELLIYDHKRSVRSAC